MAETSRLVTVVGTNRRVDTTVPGHVPLAELLWDLLDLIDEPSGPAAPRWGLTRLGGPILDLERGLAAQGVRDGAMLFLTDLAEPPRAAEFDDYAEQVAVTVDRESGHWKPPIQMAALTVAASASVAVTGAALLVLGLTHPLLWSIGLAAAALVALGAAVLSRAFRLPLSGGVLAFSTLPLWAAAGVDLAAGLQLGLLPAIAAGLAAVAVGAFLARLVGPAVQAPAAGVLVATLLAAGVLTFCSVVGVGLFEAAALAAVLGLAVMRFLPMAVVRLARIDASRTPHQSLARGRRLLAALFAGLSALLAASGIWLSLGNSWLELGLAGALALACALGARHYRFIAEILPLGAASLLIFTALELAFVRYLAVDQTRVLLIAPVLIGAAILIVGLGLLLRSRELSPNLDKRLDQIEGLAIVATVPLALGIWGLYDEVRGLLLHFL
jgi:type VII secretion integral membrane protein EccD